MAGNYFRFKQFTVHQDGSAMKVGTDGVILGAWASTGDGDERLLDIGTGTGLLALMMAQRCPLSQIDAVEIDGASADQAARNFQDSPWSSRLNIFHTSIQRFTETGRCKYGRIICNPPYFIDSLKSPDESRTTARHAVSLTHGELITAVKSLLAPKGIFSVIFPYAEANIFIAEAAMGRLYCRKKLNVIPLPGAKVKRVCAEFSFAHDAVEESNLVIENGVRHEYTEEYKALTRDFYLKF